MRKIIYTDPNELKGPRSYFTLIDPSNFQSKDEWSISQKELERILKVLLLTKEKIVIAASHLITDEAFEFFQGKEFLIKNGLIVPALRSQFNTFEELCATKNISSDKRHIIDFFSENITEVVSWSLEENAGWFTQTIENEITNIDSYLRRRTREIDPTRRQEKRFLDKIGQFVSNSKSSKGFVFREELIEFVKLNFVGEVLNEIINYLDLLYFTSGAQAVKCENYQMLRKYYETSGIDTKNSKTLQDYEIFYNIVLKLVLEIAYGTKQKINVLDNLQLSNITELRNLNPQKSELFRQQYEECLITSKELRASKDKYYMLPKLEKIKNLAVDIRSQFKDRLNNEFQEFQSVKKVADHTDNAVNLALDVVDILSLGILPTINTVVNNCYIQKIPFIQKLNEKKKTYQEAMIRKMVQTYYKNDPILLSYFRDLINLHKTHYLKEI